MNLSRENGSAKKQFWTQRFERLKTDVQTKQVDVDPQKQISCIFLHQRNATDNNFLVGSGTGKK